MPAERTTKGLNLLGLVKMIRAARRVEDLPGLLAEDRALLAKHILPGQWYPFDAFIRILVATHRTLLDGSDATARGMGRVNAEAALLGPHGIHLWTGNVARTVGSLEKTWPQLFSFGQVVMSEVVERGARMDIQGYPDMTRTHGNVVMGWVQRAAELAGGTRVEVRAEQAPWDGKRSLVITFSWA